jgi:hypothetical protein
MAKRETLIIALVLKDFGIELPDPVLAQKVSAATVVIDTLLGRKTAQPSSPVITPRAKFS